MARITRKELKTDKFALEVEQTVTFFEEHQKELIRYGGIAVAVILLIVGYIFYSNRQHAQREQALARAMQIQESPVGPAAEGVNNSFPTQEAKDQVALKAFSEVQSKYPSSAEGEIAEYYIGSIKADEGKLAEAEVNLNHVATHGDSRYASLAKLALAQIYFADGRAEQGEKLLRDLMAHPTIYVSKEQAQLALAHLLASKNPNEARKLLDPLRTVQGAIGQVALEMIGELPAQ